jgi:hypothetical protein
MEGGLFSKGSSGHSIRTIGSSHRGKSVGSSHSSHSGYIRGIGHSMPSSAGGVRLNKKLEGKINQLQNKLSNLKSDDD